MRDCWLAIPISIATILCFVCVLPSQLTAQSLNPAPLVAHDSARITEKISHDYPSLRFEMGARIYFLELLQIGEFNDAQLLLELMERRGQTAWLTPGERLLAITYIADGQFLMDLDNIERLLAGYESLPRHNISADDHFAEELRQLLRSRAEEGAYRFDSSPRLDDERIFYNLLLNHITVSGYRSREELNGRVDSFVRAWPLSPLVLLAERYIHVDYREAFAGAAVNLGYAFGNFAGDISKLVGYFYGPTLGAELYVGGISAIGSITFGNAVASKPFTARGQQWKAGDIGVISASLDLGWEFRIARLGVVPMAGVALQRLETPAPSEEGFPTELRFSTGGRIGYNAALLVGYRIVFDQGPHIDLRGKLGWTSTALGDYDVKFRGGLVSLQLTLAIVQRPYQGGEE